VLGQDDRPIPPGRSRETRNWRGTDRLMRIGDLLIDENEMVENFVRSSGPGGQNVNKVASAVELRFDARRSPSLPDDVATRLMKLAGSRLTKDGVIVIFAQRFSSQPRNREDARERLVALIAKAQERQKPRRATKPTPPSKTRRLDEKGRRGAIKALRGKAAPE
jgi:ribosome-associated protein